MPAIALETETVVMLVDMALAQAETSEMMITAVHQRLSAS
jgi:hypothetical protein